MGRVKGLEPKVTRCEVIFHNRRDHPGYAFSGNAQAGPVSVQDKNAVVIQSRHAFFEERYDHGDPARAGKFAKTAAIGPSGGSDRSSVPPPHAGRNNGGKVPADK